MPLRSDEIDESVVARCNPSTGAVETVEVLFASTRFANGGIVKLPLAAELRVAAG